MKRLIIQNGNKVTQTFEDDVSVNGEELAQAMRVSRWTIYRWKAEGYQFEFGSRTTTGHLKAWLRSRAATPSPTDIKMEEVLRRLR